MKTRTKILLIGIGCISFLIFTGCSNNNNVKTSNSEPIKINSGNQPVQITSKKAPNREDDTIFYNDRFLIIGNKEMKLDYIPVSQKTFKKSSKGDTLFNDSKATILGDNKYTTWVYVRYGSKFKFAQFPVTNIYKGVLASPDIKSNPDAKYWRTAIRDGCKHAEVNFAGHYTIVEWGCGCMCQNMAIVDRINGKIYFPDIPESHIDGYYGADFRVDSRMIISNSRVLEDYKGYYQDYCSIYPQIYEWRDTVSKRLE